MQKKKVIISGGGTGGHIFPALSIANALKRLEPDIEILFIGAEGKMEMEKVPDAGYSIIGLPVRGLSRKSLFENITVAVKFYRSIVKARKYLKTFKPDVVVGVGGFASAPVGVVASRLKIPLILQEQNSYAGVTNKLLGKRATKVCVAYEKMERFFNADKLVFTGNPVRKNLLVAKNARVEGLDYYGFDCAKKTILVTGGSLGARTLNKAMVKCLEEIGEREDIQVIWQCGSLYLKQLRDDLGRIPENVRMVSFLERMDLAYACADVVVARAGAGTISELCLLGKTTILIPSPNVAEDHQTKNAMALVEKSAAIMIKDVDAEQQLYGAMMELIDCEEKRRELTKNIEAMAMMDSDERIAKEILIAAEEYQQRKRNNE